MNNIFLTKNREIQAKEASLQRSLLWRQIRSGLKRLSAAQDEEMISQEVRDLSRSFEQKIDAVGAA
jgi:hypothetical protein